MVLYLSGGGGEGAMVAGDDGTAGVRLGGLSLSFHSILLLTFIYSREPAHYYKKKERRTRTNVRGLRKINI